VRKLIKLASILLVILLVISALAACSGSGTQTDRQDTASNAGDDKGTSGDSGEEAKSGPSWTWDTSPITIDWYISEGWYNKTWDAENCLVDKEITEKTGITVNISTPAGDADEKLNAMIASDTLPDVLTMGWWYGQFQQMQEAGMLYPLNELVDEYAPTMKPLIPESMMKWYTYEDGNWYGFPNFYWAEEHLTEDNYIKTNAGMIARKDIMTQLDIKEEDFNTQDSMVAALRKVKDAGMEYQGVNVTPVYFGPMGGVGCTFNWVLPGMFAVPREDEEGNLIYMRKHPKYLEVLKFGNRLYREGLVSQENFTSDRKQIEERMVSGGIFTFIGNMADYKGQIKDLYRTDNAAEYIPVGPVRAQDGAEPQLVSTGMNGWTVTMISRNAKNPDRIIRFIEFLYSEEGLMLTSHGVEGVTYNMEDGKVVYTDEYINAVNEDSAAATLKYGVGTWYWINNPVFLQNVEPAPATRPDEISVNIDKYFAQWVYNDAAFDNINPRGGTDEAAMDAEIGVYWEKQFVKMIMAESEEELERIYNETIKHIDELGAEQVYKVNNERFQANKAKLGIDFAWPPNKN